jgi:hypothetical protein
MDNRAAAPAATSGGSLHLLAKDAYLTRAIVCVDNPTCLLALVFFGFARSGLLGYCPQVNGS